MGGVNNSIFVEMQPPCDDIQALFAPSKFYSEPGEEVTFTNLSSNYHHCFWYMDNVLVSTTNNWTYTFTADGHHDIRLEVKDEDEICTAVYELEHHVHSPIHFCGDLELPDQDPSECPCMTTFDMNENGEMEQKTFYRWIDRWGNKYCNLSVSGNCEDNMPFKNGPVPDPPPVALCDAGYFNLYFYEIEHDRITYPTDEQQQVICQVFKDISVLLTPANPNTVVNFQIFGQYDPNTLTLASAGSYYDAMELNVLSNAIVHGSVWKAINTNSSDASIFHGLVNVNGAKNFYTGYAHDGIAAGQFDLYGIMQHEILHALGFASLITSYSGSSFYQQNNLYSTFDEHLLNNGTNVLNHNGSGTYTFNSLGNNCNAVKFNNMSAPNSPVNASMNGSFYSPSHFDDVCTNLGATPPNAINPLYVMNPSIAANQARRLQQEEVNALCKMGFVISGNYGSTTLTIGGADNPNDRTYEPCTTTGTGTHLSASNDNYLTYGQFYLNSCTAFYTVPYSINLLNDPNNLSGNDDFPQGAGVVIVDLTDLQTNVPVAGAYLLPNGFSFVPTVGGIHQFSYRLHHPQTNTYSNVAIVTIFVTSCCNSFCPTDNPVGCNLICNFEFDYSLHPDPCITQEVIPSMNNTLGWHSVLGSCDYSCTTNITNNALNTQGTLIGSGGQIVMSTSDGNWEKIGQRICLNTEKNYIGSFYFKRSEFTLEDSECVLMLENIDDSSYPPNPWTGVFQPHQDVLFVTPTINHSDTENWIQVVGLFSPTIEGNVISIGIYSFTNGNARFFIDRVELIEDEFSNLNDHYITCGQSAVLEVPTCNDITNLHYAWYELENGLPIDPPLAIDETEVVSPTITTSYRLVRYIAELNESGNNGYPVLNSSSLYAEFDITVNVLLPSGGCAFEANVDNSICSVDFVSNMPFGTHFWDFGDGETSTEVNPTHIYSSYGSYNVLHVTNEFGCECSSQQIVHMCCGQTTNFSTINQICQNSPFTLPTTSLEGIEGTWSPEFSSAIVGNATYVFTPTIDCFQSTSITVTTYNCDCDNAPGTHLSGIIDEDLDPNEEYRIVGDIEIQGTVNFESCIIAIDPNITITIPENQNLVISNSHLYGCYALWNGIDVRPNGTLKIDASLVEDAKIAVNMQALNAEVPTWRLKVSESIFNKNTVGVKINSYPFDNSNTAFDISTVAFTCREVTTDPNTWPSLAAYLAPNPNANNNNFEDPKIDPDTYPEIDPLYVLINNGLDLSFTNPYGMWLHNVGNTINPNVVPTFNSFHLGSTNENLPWVFDRMARGVYAMRSNVEVSRPTIFQGKNQNHAVVTYGIYAEAYIQPPGTQILYNPFDGIIKAGANQDQVQFYNVSHAVYVDDYTHVNVQKCRIRSKRSMAPGFSHIGSTAVRYKSPKSAQLVFENNEVHNIRDGVYALIGHPVIGTKIDLNITNNVFGRLLSDATGIISETAIQIAAVSPSNILYPNPFIIEKNTISGTRRGIYLVNLDVAGIHIERNSITIEENIGTPWNTKARFFGIHLRTVSSSGSRIYENDIEGFNTVNTQARGIWMDNSSQINVLCNNTKYIGAGLYFYGNCQSRVLQNNMLMNRYGLWLDGQGYIGQQGNAGSAAGNTWSGSGSTAWTQYQAFQQPPTTSAYRIKTYVSQFSFADQSPMYVLPLSASNPSNSWAAENPDLVPFATLSSPQSLFLTNTIGNPHLCEVGPPVGDDPAGLDAPNGIIDFDKFLLALEKDAEISTGNTDTPSEVIREQLTYDYLYKNPDIRDSSIVLDSFYVTRESENVGILREMNQKLDEHLLDDAEALRNQVIPNNLVEFAYREVLDLQLKYERGLFTEVDSTELHLWAESCFYVYGKAVPIAQSLYNLINGTTIFFPEDCPEYLPRSVSINKPSNEALDIVLYPNPNSNTLFGKVNEEDVKTAFCVIRTIDGKIIYNGSFHFTRGLDLSNLGLNSGVYTVELSFEARDELIIKKLVFLK